MVDYRNFGEVKDVKDGRCSSWLIVVIILVIVVLGLTALLVVTFVLNFNCEECKSSGLSDINHKTSFLLFSDIHLDPRYTSKAGKDSFCRNNSKPSVFNAPYGRIGCDSSKVLLEELLKAMKEQARNQKQLDFVMMSGDSCAHRIEVNRTAEILSILKETTTAVRSSFPNIPYFPSIGNNDLPGHYRMPVENDTWYSDVLAIWQDAILCRNCSLKTVTTTIEELRTTFLFGGYYRVSIASDKMILLVLNSMYWTIRTWRADNYFQDRANEQMKWVEMQLEKARLSGKKVILTSHIPPGIDSYSGKTLWWSNFTELYVDLVANKFSDVVAGQIYAHFHKDEFRFLQKNDNFNSSYILLVPSISPVYKNNPGFRVVYFDQDLQAISDYEQWYMNIVMATEFDNPVWQLDYIFSWRYPPENSDDHVINGKRIKCLSDNIINQSNDSYFNGFISSRQVRYQPDPFSRFHYYCSIAYYSQHDFDVCRKKYLVPGG